MTDSVERIDDSAFECCKRNLLLFDSQTNLEYIGRDAFRFCVL